MSMRRLDALSSNDQLEACLRACETVALPEDPHEQGAALPSAAWAFSADVCFLDALAQNGLWDAFLAGLATQAYEPHATKISRRQFVKCHVLALVHAGQHEDALALLERLLIADPEAIGICIDFYHVCLLLGDPEGAKLYRERLGYEPDHKMMDPNLSAQRGARALVQVQKRISHLRKAHQHRASMHLFSRIRKHFPDFREDADVLERERLKNYEIFQQSVLVKMAEGKPLEASKMERVVEAALATGNTDNVLKFLGYMQVHFWPAEASFIISSATRVALHAAHDGLLDTFKKAFDFLEAIAPNELEPSQHDRLQKVLTKLYAQKNHWVSPDTIRPPTHDAHRSQPKWSKYATANWSAVHTHMSYVEKGAGKPELKARANEEAAVQAKRVARGLPQLIDFCEEDLSHARHVFLLEAFRDHPRQALGLSKLSEITDRDPGDIHAAVKHFSKDRFGWKLVPLKRKTDAVGQRLPRVGGGARAQQDTKWRLLKRKSKKRS